MSTVKNWVFPSVREGYCVEVRQLTPSGNTIHAIYVYRYQRDWPNPEGIYELPKLRGTFVPHEMWDALRGLVKYVDLPDDLQKFVDFPDDLKRFDMWQLKKN